MRAISLWQPWASAMALGIKMVETRHWSTDYRGPLAIHAAKRWQADEREWAKELAYIYDAPVLANPPLGAIVAVTKIVDVKTTDLLLPSVSEYEEMLGNYEPGRYGWICEGTRRLSEPIPYRGHQSFFDIPDSIFPEGFAPSAAERLL